MSSSFSSTSAVSSSKVVQRNVTGGYVTDYSAATGSNINYNKLSAKSRQLIRRSYELGDSAAGMRKLYEVGIYQVSTFYYLHDD